MINLMQLANTLRTSPNPMQLFCQVAQQSPQGVQVLRLMQNNPQGFRSIVENMAKERGTTLENVVSQMGFKLTK